MTPLLARLFEVLAQADVRILHAPHDLAAACVDWRGRFHGAALAVLQPATTEDVAATVRACANLGLRIVPQGGNTGLCGGATPMDGAAEVVLSLARLNRVREIDVAGGFVIVEAGCVLASLQQAVREQDKYFPLSLAAEGSAQIGGVLSTNAGGTAVLKYGNARDFVLGLEVVLADGTTWHGLRSLRKDNTGYDLRNLFVGSEGTLGIITAATLKIHPLPRVTQSALLALATPAQAMATLGLLHQALGDRVAAFEAFDAECLAMTLKHHPDARDPFERRHAWYALVELTDTSPQVPLHSMAEAALAQALEAGLVADAALAASEAQRAAFWALRERIPEAQKREGFTLKHDIAVPLNAVPFFLETAGAALRGGFPGVAIGAFGHFGDGNLHFNVRPPVGLETTTAEAAIAEVVYAEVMALGGSFSAEHGVGQLKLAELARYKSPVEMHLFRLLKDALDPAGRLNPGKVLAFQEGTSSAPGLALVASPGRDSSSVV